MRIFFIVLVGFIYVGTSAQKTYVPDDSFEQYLIWIGIDDELDDSVLTANIVDVQNLHLGYSSIHDLTGLEGFLSLDTLVLTELVDSDISYLDMSVIPWLKYLDCYNQNGQIDSINLSQNTSLKFLKASGNMITEIDLSQNVMLETLAISFNQLSEIDLSHNLLLKDLSINHNNLTSLDLEINDSLVSLTCSSNTIAELNLSDKPHLSSVFCEDNEISVLDISNTPEFSRLWCSRNQISELDVLNKPNLFQLFAGDNLLSSLDLSFCSSLIWIRLFSNQLFELNVANGINSYMSGFPGGGIEYIPDFTDNPDLTCITVDNVELSTEWWNTEGYPIFENPNGYVAIDSTMYFSLNCASVLGCIDEMACNYNSKATESDNSCLYIGDVCDDDNPDTLGDVIQENCECEGTQESIIYELSSESMFIYPNPAVNTITVDLDHLEGSTATLNLYDYSGKLVYENQTSSRTIIDISDFAKGLYTLVVFNSKKILSGKVLVD
jgi:Leucine-rich repeat (LRR) protein